MGFLGVVLVGIACSSFISMFMGLFFVLTTGRCWGLFLTSAAILIVTATSFFFGVAPSNVSNKLLDSVYDSVFSSNENPPQYKPNSEFSKQLKNSPLFKD